MLGLIALVGGSEFQPGCELADEPLLRLAGGSSAKVAILAAAPAHEDPVLAAQNGVSWFGALGARAEAVMLVDAASAQDEVLADTIEGANLIYLTGGDPGYLLRTLRGSRAWRSVRHAHAGGSVVMGSSAGAMVLGGLVWSSAGQGFEDGLGLVPELVVVPHHDGGGREWAEHLRGRLPAELSLLGIAEQTAAVWSGANWQVLGPGEVTVYSGKKERIYRHGQVFNLG